MPEIRILANMDKRNPGSIKLNERERNVHSQAGEDGIIEAIFETIGAKNKWCVEFGAWDGVHFSNTCRLIREEGWSAVMIEGDEDRCAEIRQNHPDAERVLPMHRWVGFDRGKDTIDDILKETPIPLDFDLISIDIDGIDWHVWNSIVDYRPRVVVIEFNPTVPNGVHFVQDRDMRIAEGCSVASLPAMAKAKGYELVCVNIRNAFFVVKEEFDKFGIEDNSVDAMRKDRPNFIWNCYSGKIYHSMPKLAWWGKHVPLECDSLQLLNQYRMQGDYQGTPADRFAKPAQAEHDLTTADGIVRELSALRFHRAELDEEEWKERNREAWKAVKRWSLQINEWVTAEDVERLEREAADSETAA